MENEEVIDIDNSFKTSVCGLHRMYDSTIAIQANNSSNGAWGRYYNEILSNRYLVLFNSWMAENGTNRISK